MTTAIDRPLKISYVLVEFQYGDDAAPLYYRITDKTSDVVLFGQSWDSVPDFKIQLPMDVGTLSDAQADMEMKLQPGFLTTIASDDVFSRVRVTVLEVIDSEIPGDSPDVCYLFVGNLSQAIRNPAGHSESVKLILVRETSRLGYPLGISANHLCQWTFTKRGCFIDALPLPEQGTLTAASGKTVTITGLADHSADPTGRYWHRGHVSVDGARIQIRDWLQTSATTFILREEPPASWVGATVTVFPGCDKQYATCDQRWDNKARFMGNGVGIPTYHPSFESPT